MRLSALVRGKHFGNLGKVYGEYKMAISPNEQKPFKHFWDDAFVKVFKSYVWRDWVYYVPPSLAAYLLYDWAKKENYRANRKNPADYANDT